MKHWKQRLALLSAAAMLCGVFGGCAKTEESVMDNHVVVNTQKVDVGSVALSTTYVGSLSAQNTIYVMPLVSGTVKEVYVAVGDTVSEGDPLCQFDDTSAKLTLNSAYAGYNSVAAQKDAALGSSWELSSYQTQAGIDSAERTLNQLYESRDALLAQKAAVEATYTQLLAEAEAAKAALVTALTALGIATPDDDTFLRIAEQIGDLDMSLDSGAYSTAVSNILTNAALTAEAPALSGSDIADKVTTLYTKQAALAEAAASLRTIQSSLNQLENSIESAQAGLQNAQDMQEITENRVRASTEKTLNRSLASAQTSIDAARYQVSLYKINAPVSGVVQSVSVTANNLFASGQAAFVIANGDAKQLTFYVTEAVAQQLIPGQPVEAVHGDKTYSGTVVEIGNAADLQKGLFKVKANLDNAAELPNGITLKLSTVTSREDTQLIVPCDAVRYIGGRSYVYINDNGVARQVEVETGIYDNDNIVITAGLQKGDEIVTTWSPNLIDGAVLVNAAENS